MVKVLSFHGSRILDSQKIYDKIGEEIEKHNPDYVVTHGEASGVCALTREYCKRNGISLKLHFLNVKKHAQGAYAYRSVNVIKECDYCIFIHDGESKGTLNELELAKKLKKPYSYYEIKDIGVDEMKLIGLNVDTIL